MKRQVLMLLATAGGYAWAGAAEAAGYGEGGGFHHDGMMGYYGGGPMMGWMGPIMMIVVVVLIAVVVWAVLNAGGGHGKSHRGVDPALSLLRERYARGEIDHEEYEQRKRRLE